MPIARGEVATPALSARVNWADDKESKRKKNKNNERRTHTPFRKARKEHREENLPLASTGVSKSWLDDCDGLWPRGLDIQDVVLKHLAAASRPIGSKGSVISATLDTANQEVTTPRRQAFFCLHNQHAMPGVVVNDVQFVSVGPMQMASRVRATRIDSCDLSIPQPFASDASSAMQ